MKKIRLVVAEDHELVGDGLRRLLEPEFEVVAGTVDGRSAVSEYERLRPDAVLLDISLPLLNGIEAARQIRTRHRAARIVIVSMHMDRHYVEQAFQAGADAYVAKNSPGEELIQAIKTAVSGGHFISPILEKKFGALVLDTTRKPAELFGGRLTPRQREVLQLIAEGKPMKEIASVLEISVRTVEFHKSSIGEVLGIRTTAELTRFAIDNGIVGNREAGEDGPEDEASRTRPARP